MAALRVVLSKAKACRGCGYGLLGGISSSSILHRNSIFNSRFPSDNQSCRHYFLPPPPPRSIIEFIVGCDRYFPVANRSKDVSSAAKCAVKCHNNTPGGDLRFVRVVRASAVGLPGRTSYCMTLEAFDNKAGELNVYYAEVYVRRSKNIQMLERWQLVDESFYYPFIESRIGERLRKSRLLEKEIDKNKIVGAWLSEFTPQCTDFADMADIDPMFGVRERNPDPLRTIFDFEKKAVLNTDDRQPCPPENASHPPATVPSDFVATVYDNAAYKKIYRYAHLAVCDHNKNEDDEVHLEEVLWASKSKAEKGAHYFLLLEAMDRRKELKFYYAIIKAYRSVELIEWHPIQESSYHPLQQE